MNEPDRKFDTERIRCHRAGQLSESGERTVTNIERFGCGVIHVKSSHTNPGWSYTVGVYDICGRPEVITIGLRNDKTVLFLLNEAARRLRQGINLGEGRHRDLLDSVECEFRPVDPKWVKHLMGRAIWYYGDADFPVLQAIYPDLENRFPEETGFEKRFQQPLLQMNAPMTVVESDFWASADPDSSLFNWNFPDPPHTMVFLSKAVNTGVEPITYASHDLEDGTWQFLGDSMAGEAEPVISCFHHAIDNDSSLNELADLPLGWWAERTKPGDPWTRHQHEPEDDQEEE
jgi:hypothetical protein